MNFQEAKRCDAGGRGPRGGAGRHGMVGGRGAGAGGRMLGQGGLKLIALALIAEQPRHGYDIIKVIEEKTDGSYAPSPGVIYPTLTFLEEAGHVTSQPDGAKKLYAVTDEGRAHLATSSVAADAAFEELKLVRQRPSTMHRRNCRSERENALPSLICAALDDLRAASGKQLVENQDMEADIVAILARAAGEIRKVSANRQV